jgi:hypothetical protein
MSQKRFDAIKAHTTPSRSKTCRPRSNMRERIDDAIKVVVKTRSSAAQRVAAE